MTYNNIEYYIILITFLSSLVLATLLTLIAKLLKPTQPDVEKLSSYECGFDPFTANRIPFNIHFFLIAILFIMFDLEIVLLLPWALNVAVIGPRGFWTVVLFLVLLVIAFIYEWRAGALDWRRITHETLSKQ